MMTQELYHHGVKGQKWGVRRTRSQLGYPESKPRAKKEKSPRSAKKKQAARLKAASERVKRQNAREEILRSPTKLYKHRNEFTRQEIDDAMRRFEWERRLNEFSNYEINAGKRYVDTLLGYADTGIRAYNTYAKVYNAFNKSGKQRKTIGEKSKQDKKKKKDDEDDD